MYLSKKWAILAISISVLVFFPINNEIKSQDIQITDGDTIKIDGEKIRSYGFTQLSVAIDLHGDIFLFREAGFLNREGNEKVIIGRLDDQKNSLEKNIKIFLKNKKPFSFDENDSRLLDSFDHVLNALVNQAEQDEKFGIPLNLGPIAFKNFDKKNNKIVSL